MRRDIFTAKAPRWCRVRADSSPEGDLFPLDDDGFLGSDHTFAQDGAQAVPGALMAAGDVARDGATVLLGEPGAGKTTVFKSLVQGLPVWDDSEIPDGADRYVWIDGPDLTPATYDEALGSHLAALPKAGASQGSEQHGILTVVIDQADESEICSNLPSYVKRSLRNKDVRGMRMLIACRTGDYPPGLTAVLHEAFGSCSLVDLAPLSRADAEMLVDSAGLPGEQLLSEVVALRAGAFASVPLTLELIVREYQSSGRLRGGAEELFEDGVRLLADEYDPNRLSLAAPTTNWRQRVEVAGRIAARLVLSGRRTLWWGSLLDERPRTTDLDVSTVSGGNEQILGFQSFDVTPQVVDEVMSTGLFTASGNHRFAFRHSSLAAFLAAQHLLSRTVPDSALRELFLVGAPDEETASIPISLRETAAWLVAFAPDRTRWLASADPESLTMHSGLVRSDSIRELIVERLLERAADVELGDARWHHTRWVLGHPGLADQLVPALTLDPADFDDWPTWARARVALQLAEQCPSPVLAPLLLKVAADPRWPADNRAQAARAAVACDAASSLPSLKDVLATLGATKDANPLLSLRGALLTLLWPHALDTATMLDALGEAPSTDRYGAYEHFIAGMPSACPEEDVDRVVSWLVRSTANSTLGGDGREDRLVAGVIDRALSIRGAEPLLPDLARIVTTRLLNHHKVGFPHSLDQITPEGQEPTSVRDLRRKLATALLRCGIEAEQPMRYFAWVMVRDWEPQNSWSVTTARTGGDRHTLLDAGDFDWALREATDQVELADAYAHLAEILFDQSSQEHFELAYRSKDNPAWTYLKWFYEPIEIDGYLAKSWRMNHRATFKKPWPESAQFIVRQRMRLREARRHNIDEFWLLLWNLQIDPSTGEGERLFDDNLSEWPGCSIFDAAEISALPDCALDFLRREKDRSELRPWAGIQSLALLNREGRLEELDPDSWSSWVEAITDSWSISQATWTTLLQNAAVKAPVALSHALRTAAGKDLAEGTQPLILERLDANWHPMVATVMEDVLAVESVALLPGFHTERTVDGLSVPEETLEEGSEGRAALIRSWSALLSRLLTIESALAQSVTEFALARVQADGGADEFALPVRAAYALLGVDGFDAWLRLRPLMDTSDGFSRALALSYASRSTRGHLENNADEAALSTLYRWLCALFPQDEYARPLGVHVVTPEMEALAWREALPVTLSRRGTPAAVEQLKALADDFPDRLNLRAALINARTNLLAATWTPTDLDEVTAILAGVRRSSQSMDDHAQLVAALEGLQDIGRHDFRDDVVREMRRFMGSDRVLPIADHNVPRDHLLAIVGYVYGEGGAPAQRALLAALEALRPEERALEPVRALLTAPAN